MKTKLTLYAQINYPLEFKFGKESLMRRLQRMCEDGELSAEKERGRWVVLHNDYNVESIKMTNPLVAA